MTDQQDTVARITLLVQIEDSLTKYIKQTAKRNIETNMFHFKDFHVVRLIILYKHQLFYSKVEIDKHLYIFHLYHPSSIPTIAVQGLTLAH